MSDRATSRVEVSIGDVHGSQLVIGEHNTIQTPEGTEVTVLQVGERPAPKLRPMPISRRPNPVEIVGREEELALLASSSAGMAVQLYAEDGAGKTSLLKFAAGHASAPAEGVVFEPARHRSLDEIQVGIYAAFWECDVPFIPNHAQIGDFLADREALLILDDCGLDRSDLETLLDRLPRCTVVLASEGRTLWSRGTARRLGELDPVAAVQLLEHELGHALAPEEMVAAEAVVARLEGNPQALVETAALIEDGRGSLRELADDPAALERRFDPSALSDSQRRILETLSALDGAALGVEHVSAVAGLPDAERELRRLERRGWVKPGSPRYRSLRKLPPDPVSSSQSETTKPLLGYLTAWSRTAGPQAVADEAEAIERTLELGAAAKQWEETLALSLATERGLFVAGAWSSCQQVLQIGLEAAEEAENECARAYVMHQLGSQSLCLGDRAEAAAQLGGALQIREDRGEEAGADLTRHNLRQLEGGENGDDNGKNGDPPHPWTVIVLAVLALVAAGILGALALAGGDGDDAADIDPITTTVPPGADPVIVIERPGKDSEFEEGDPFTANFHCTAAEGAGIDSCEGAIDGVPIDDGDPLEMSAGNHTLRVTAVDDESRESVEEVSYSVSESGDPAQVDEEPPEISVSSPTSGPYELGEFVLAEYTCTDESEVTCTGTKERGVAIDTETIGPHKFTVTAVDSAGNEAAPVIVTYEVIQSTDDVTQPKDGVTNSGDPVIQPTEEEPVVK